MMICVDFDGSIVKAQPAYTPLSEPLQMIDGASAGLHALKRAGHKLVLFSARANRSLRTPYLLMRQHPELDIEDMLAEAELHQARYQQMLDYVEQNLPEMFDCIDDGTEGKPLADLFIDDRCIKHHSLGVLNSMDWSEIAEMFGE